MSLTHPPRPKATPNPHHRYRYEVLVAASSSKEAIQAFRAAFSDLTADIQPYDTHEYDDDTWGVFVSTDRAIDTNENPLMLRVDDHPEPSESVDAPREDMVAYMTAANEQNSWHRPAISTRHLPDEAGMVLNTVLRPTPVYTITLEGGLIDAKRFGDKPYVLHRRNFPARDPRWHLPYWGEACLDVRYWLLQAEINDVDMGIHCISDAVIDCIINSSPPEWSDDIHRLIDKYRLEDEPDRGRFL